MKCFTDLKEHCSSQEIEAMIFFLWLPRIDSFLSNPSDWKKGGRGRTCHDKLTIKPIHKWNNLKEIVFASIWREKKICRDLYLWYTGWMLSSDGEFNWGPSPFSCSAQSSNWVDFNTSSLPEGSYSESLVQVSLLRILLAFKHVASVLLGSPRSVSSSWYKKSSI